jgi:hypothetical protein
MGDRTWLSITFAKNDRSIFKHILGDDPEEEWNDNDKTIRWQMYEMNYGGYSFIEELAANKLTFDANSGSGDEYGPMSYVCFKGHLIEMQTTHDGDIFVRMDENGVDKHDLDEARQYFRIGKKVDAYYEKRKEYNARKKHDIVKQTMSLWGK